MTKVPGTANTWEWELTPNDFFNITASQTIYRLGIVFRNTDGSKEGKSATNSDFFIDLSQGFQVSFANPKSSSILLEIGDTQEITILASEIAELSISINGVQVAAASSKDKLSYIFQAQSEGAFSILATASKGQQSDSEDLLITVVGKSPKEQLPAGIKKGINYLSETEVILVLEAPKKKMYFSLEISMTGKSCLNIK